MSYIKVEDAKAWAESTKLAITSLDVGLLEQVESQVIGRIGVRFDHSTWLSPDTTPRMVRSVIAMFYVAWLYDRQYSEDQEEGNDYAALLRAQAEALILGILDGSVVLPEVPDTGTEPGGPSFYPTDESSAMEPTDEDPSLGGAAFSMSTRF